MPAPSSSSLTASQVLAMVERQGYRCAITGRPLSPETAVLDHIVPVGRGGRHHIDNVWVVDAQVNAAKGTLTMGEFLAVCCDAANGPAQADPSKWMNAGAVDPLDENTPVGAGDVAGGDARGEDRCP